MNILNFREINEQISTAGQPTEEEFKTIFQNGFEVVINLALSNSSNALENEDKVVTSFGMIYIHLPVDFEYPTLKNLNDFLKLLKLFEGRKVFVHCAKNYRVSAFMYVYHKYILQTPFDEIDLSIFEEWTPSQRWQNLMKTPIDEIDSI